MYCCGANFYEQNLVYSTSVMVNYFLSYPIRYQSKLETQFISDPVFFSCVTFCTHCHCLGWTWQVHIWELVNTRGQRLGTHDRLPGRDDMKQENHKSRSRGIPKCTPCLLELPTRHSPSSGRLPRFSILWWRKTSQIAVNTLRKHFGDILGKGQWKCQVWHYFFVTEWKILSHLEAW